MKIYEWTMGDKAMMLTSTSSMEAYQKHPISSRFDGSAKSAIWTPFQVETLRKGRHRDLPHLIIGKPVVSAKVKQAVEPFIAQEVEFLPLLHDELELYMLNVLNVLDCVNRQCSVVTRTKKGSFSGFKKLVFDPTKIPANTYLFKIAEVANTRVFVTEAFKNLIEAHKFKGLVFQEIYDSEITEQMEQEQQQKYEAMVAAIDASGGARYSFDEARRRVDEGAVMASGKWKMQLDEQGRFWLGELGLDCKYHWLMPVYLPPIILGLAWHEVDKSGDFSSS